MKNELKNTLTGREYEVFIFVVKGFTTTKIANELALKSNTISTIKKNIHNKLGTNSDIELFKLAYKNSLVNL